MAKNIAEESGQIGGSSGSVLVLRHVENLRGLRAVLAGGREHGGPPARRRIYVQRRQSRVEGGQA